MKLKDTLKLKERINRESMSAPEKPEGFEKGFKAPQIFERLLDRIHNKLSVFFVEERPLESLIHLFGRGHLKVHNSIQDLSPEDRRNKEEFILNYLRSEWDELIVIAGGAVSDFFIEKIRGTKMRTRDIDIFISERAIEIFETIKRSTIKEAKTVKVTQDIVEDFLRYIFGDQDFTEVIDKNDQLNFLEYRGLSELKSVKRFTFNGNNIDVIITPNKHWGKELISSFDFCFRSAYYSRHQGLHLSQDAYRSIREGKLYINNLETPLSALVRGYEFAERYNFQFPGYYIVYILDRMREELNIRTKGAYEQINTKKKQKGFKNFVFEKLKKVTRYKKTMRKKVGNDIEKYLHLADNQDPLFIFAKFISKRTTLENGGSLDINDKVNRIFNNRCFDEIDALRILSEDPTVLRGFNRIIPLGIIDIEPKINNIRQTDYADFAHRTNCTLEISEALFEKRVDLENYIKINNIIKDEHPYQVKENFINNTLSKGAKKYIITDYEIIRNANQVLSEMLFQEYQNFPGDEKKKRELWLDKCKKLELDEIPYEIFSNKAFMCFESPKRLPLEWFDSHKLYGKVFFLNELDLDEKHSKLQRINQELLGKESLEVIEEFKRFYRENGLSDTTFSFSLEYKNGSYTLSNINVEGYYAGNDGKGGKFLSEGEIKQIIDKIKLYLKEVEGIDVAVEKINTGFLFETEINDIPF